MKSFEYEITSHPADSFKDLVYFCTSEGSCSVENLPSHQLKKMQDFLNERGRHGWELIQASFGKNGVVVFWKRLVRDDLVR